MRQLRLTGFAVARKFARVSNDRCGVTEMTPDLHAELLRAAALGDELAFAELYRLTSARLYGVARRLLRSTDLASDALQEAFVRIWTDAARFDPDRGQPLHWMLAIQRNICLDMLRRAAVRPGADVDLDDIELAVPAAEGASRDLERCLHRLDPQESEAILMAVHYGLSHTELARRFDVPLGTMKSTIRRALLRLRGCLEPEEPHAAPIG